MSERKAEAGDGHFRWDPAGWFGAQLGGTLWLILWGGILLVRNGAVGAVPLAAGLLVNGLGVMLWTRRDRIRAYPAFQILVASIGALGLAAAGGVHLLVLERELDPSLLELPRRLYWAILVIPAIMVFFHLTERRARSRRS